MRYCTNLRLSPGLGSAVHYFRANSIHDPDRTGVGHQPMKHDEMAMFYNHYMVKSSVCKVYPVGFTNTGTDAAGVVYGCLLTDDTALPWSDFKFGVESGACSYSVMSPTVGASGKKLSKGFSAKSFFNIQDIRDNRSLLGATFNANPSEEAVFAIWTQAINGPSAASALDFIIVIDYTVVFSEPKDLGES